MFGGGPEDNDLRDDGCPDGHMFLAVCEGCGKGFFDRAGRKLESLPAREDQGGIEEVER